jgi:hypothetical protein
VSLPPRPAALSGREELLAGLHELLTRDGAPCAVVLSGMGGVGKTSLAAEYAHRHLTEVGVAWQVRCEDRAVLAQDMAELAAQVGGRELADLRDPVASAHAVLAAFGLEWLLIFDNAADEPSIRRFLPPAGPGRVVVTSQSQHWPGRQVLDVPVLDPDVAVQFLVNRAADQDHATAATLAAELGRLPLALEQAAAYVQATTGTLAGYLALFRQRRADLLARGGAAGHPPGVAATLGVALARLDADAPAAVALLRLLACLAPEPVPLGLLLSDADVASELDPEVAAALGPLLGDPLAVGDAVAALRGYSLVTSASDQMVLVHRLVQVVTLEQAPADAADRWRAAAAILTDAAIPGDTSLPGTWPVCAVLLPHAQAVLDLTSGGMWRIAQYLGQRGSYAAAVQLLQRIVDTRDRALGFEHPLTLTARNNLAYWTGEAGDTAGAREQYAAVVPAMERVLGPEHPETLAARRGLAAWTWTGVAGNAAAARDEFAELLPLFERVLGPKHPDTLDIRGNLAHWTGEAGDAVGARDQYAALLPVAERVLGPEHPDALDVRGNLADWTGKAGNATAARDQYAALLPVRERVTGPEHPEILTDRAALAHWTGEAGDAAGARDQFAGLLSDRERILGAEHPSTLATRGNLAYWTEKADRSAG